MCTVCIQNSYRMYIQIIVCKMDPSFQNILTSIFCALPSLLIIGLFQKNKQTGGGAGWGDTFLMPPRIFHFFYFNFTPRNSRQNKALHPWILQNYVRSLGNPKAKNWDPSKFHIVFSWPPLKIPLCFYITPGNSTFYFFDTPGNSISSTPLPPPPPHTHTHTHTHTHLFGFFLQ